MCHICDVCMYIMFGVLDLLCMHGVSCMFNTYFDFGEQQSYMMVYKMLEIKVVLA